MKRRIIFILIIWLGFIFDADAISTAAKQKYPYPLLTDDYGILTDNDIAAFTWGLKPRPFTSDKDSGEYTYWQCFPREFVYMTLEDTGSSSEDFGWRDSIGDLQIRVWVRPDLVHQYEMRAAETVSDFQKRFNHWRRLMKGEKYVCLAGNFSSRYKKIEDGRVKEIYAWIFEEMKTKKGCDSYFYECNRTYKQYKKEITQEKEREKKTREATRKMMNELKADVLID